MTAPEHFKILRLLGELAEQAAHFLLLYISLQKQLCGLPALPLFRLHLLNADMVQRDDIHVPAKGTALRPVILAPAAKADPDCCMVCLFLKPRCGKQAADRFVLHLL